MLEDILEELFRLRTGRISAEPGNGDLDGPEVDVARLVSIRLPSQRRLNPQGAATSSMISANPA
jgi:hypothetical protein